MRCNWRRWLWGIIPILLLAWLAVWAERDRMEADLGERARIALRLAGMEWAVARFEGRDAMLQGMATGDADPQRAADLLRGIWGVRSIENKAELPPKIEKYTWRASRRGQRIRLRGYVPSKAVRRAIVGVTKANFPSFEVIDRMNTARGEPAMDTWLAGISFALKQLSALKRGDVLIEGLGLSVMGEADDAAAYRAVNAALKAMPKGVTLANNYVKAPAMSPYTWAAKLQDGRLVLTGHYPNDGAKEQLLAAARASLPGAAIQDGLAPAEGAPQDWASAVAAGVQAVGRLEGGSAELKDASLTVSGIAGDVATAETVRVALRGALPPSIKLTEQIRAKESPPSPTPPAPAAPAVAPAPTTGEPPSAAPAAPQAREPPQPRRGELTPTPRPPTVADMQAKACQDSLASVAQSGQLLFQFASADLDAASTPTLDKLAAAAKSCPDMRIQIAGHASAEGGADANQQLSVRRAQAVAAYLARAGVNAARLEAVGYGATRPVAPNDTNENMAKNRRIEFTVRPN
jgi:OmpA-OmpF porin, OOP family